LCGEGAEVNLFAFDSYACLVTTRVLTDTFVLVSVVLVLASVSLVLTMCAKSQVFDLVVAWVSIPVVDLALSWIHVVN